MRYCTNFYLKGHHNYNKSKVEGIDGSRGCLKIIRTAIYLARYCSYSKFLLQNVQVICFEH